MDEYDVCHELRIDVEGHDVLAVSSSVGYLVPLDEQHGLLVQHQVDAIVGPSLTTGCGV